jgi:hypothetical protein
MREVPDLGGQRLNEPVVVGHEALQRCAGAKRYLSAYCRPVHSTMANTNAKTLQRCACAKRYLSAYCRPVHSAMANAKRTVSSTAQRCTGAKLCGLVHFTMASTKRKADHRVF